MNNKLLIIDCFALIYRAYYAFPPSLTNTKGEPVNAVFGFSSLLLDVILKFNPTHVLAVMDSAGATARQTDYSFYKSNRDEADNLMVVQIPRIAEVLESMGIQILKADGIEADDIIGTVSKALSSEWSDIIVVTGDQDLFQLIDGKTKIYLASRKFSESKIFEREEVKEKLGIYPENVPDYKSIAGDASDNIPGVKGIGPKGAVDLITKFGTLEEIYKRIEEVDKKYKEKLIENIEIAQTSKHLATINTSIPIIFDINKSKFVGVNLSKTKDIFNDLEFKSLVVKLDKVSKAFGEHNTVDLFSAETIEMSFDPSTLSTNLTELNDSQEIFIFKKGEGDFILSGDQETLYAANKDETLKVVKDKKVIGFHLKDIKEILAVSGSHMDLMISGVVIGGGKVTPTINSVLRFFNAEPSENPAKIVQEMKKVYVALKTDYAESRVVKLENDILPVVIQMEENGIYIDKVSLVKGLESLQKDRIDVQDRIFAAAGHELNINSPKQIGELLFVERKLSGARKTKTGAYSTDERTLMDLYDQDPIIGMILEYRELDKMISTYLSPLPTYVDSDNRIHGTFDQIGAVSGRFSSKNPNIQNIPKGEFYGVNVRDAFIASEGNTLLSFDYSQQELRILAALAEEETMLEYYNTNRDVHILTASQLFEVEEKDVTKEQRNVGKTVNFSIIYGISAFGLSDRLKIPRDTASQFINKFYETYPKIKTFMDKVLGEARTSGYTETVLGRRRYNEMIKSNNRNLKAAAERELFNFIIQGSAADIMKMVLTQIDSAVNSENKLIAQIHDEYLFESKNSSDNIEVFVRKVYYVMKEVLDLGVEFKVEVNIGDRWGSLTKYDINE